MHKKKLSNKNSAAFHNTHSLPLSPDVAARAEASSWPEARCWFVGLLGLAFAWGASKNCWVSLLISEKNAPTKKQKQNQKRESAKKGAPHKNGLCDVQECQAT